MIDVVKVNNRVTQIDSERPVFVLNSEHIAADTNDAHEASEHLTVRTAQAFTVRFIRFTGTMPGCHGFTSVRTCEKSSRQTRL